MNLVKRLQEKDKRRCEDYDCCPRRGKCNGYGRIYFKSRGGRTTANQLTCMNYR